MAMSEQSGGGRSLVQLSKSSPEAVSALVRALVNNNDVVKQATVWGIKQAGESSPEVASALVRALGRF